MVSLPRISGRISLLALLLLMSACSLMPDYPARYIEAPMSETSELLAEPDEVAVENPATAQHGVLARLYQQYDEWRGVRYQKGGMSKNGIDCSGFVKQTFATLFDMKLPRDTYLQAKLGVAVVKEGLRSGDLVFFRINKQTQHVGIYLEENKFLHASTSSGVMISNMTHPYWQHRYWKSVRVES